MPGPQTLALENKADILLYGGAAGGGKTDLLLGLAHLHHRRSIIFRREYGELKGVIDRSRELLASAGEFNQTDLVWKLRDGRMIEFAGVQHVLDELKFQGRPHDLKAFDEVPRLAESQFRFLCGWLRSADPKQRCRVVATGNPPMSAEQEWVIKYWAPWLDPQHPHPAEPGELRWFSTIDGKDKELESGEPFPHKGELITPQSRTFIPAKVTDNPHLAGYVAQLQALPEPLRSKMLFGDFTAGRDDDPWQVIPAAWVLAAQSRWKPDGGTAPMDALGVDVARGGADRTVITARRGPWFAEQLVFPGSATPDGPAVAALAMKYREDNATVNVDVIGVGTSVFDSLRAAIGARAVQLNGAAGSKKRDRSRQMGFLNLRAELYWSLREALDPEHGDDLALPPDPGLRADLCAPRWKLTARGVQVESKEDLIKRLGRSPDKGDSLVYASALPYFPGRGMYEYCIEELERIGANKVEQQLESRPPVPMTPPVGAASRYALLDGYRIDVGGPTVDVPADRAAELERLGFRRA